MIYYKRGKEEKKERLVRLNNNSILFTNNLKLIEEILSISDLLVYLYYQMGEYKKAIDLELNIEKIVITK